MEFPGLLVLGFKSFEGYTRVTDLCGVSGVKLFFSGISWDKIENLKITVGVFKKVCPQSTIFFSGKGYLMKTYGVNRKVTEGTSKKTSKMLRIFQNLDFSVT